jgi:hypothetical protein
MNPNTSKALIAIISGLLIPVWLRVKRQRAERRAARAAALREGRNPDAAILVPAPLSKRLLLIFAALAVLAALLLLDARRP